MRDLGRGAAAIVLGMGALFLLVQKLDSGEALRAEALGEPSPSTRLVVFWVDSLAREDVEVGTSLPHLREHLASALEGPVRECSDAVSVPCLNAMTTGIDRFSMLAVASNFANASGMAPGSVLAAFQARGLRVGFAGDQDVAPALRGLDWTWTTGKLEDEQVLEQAMAALDRERLDVLLVHFREPDHIAHKQRPTSTAYADALRASDDRIERARAKLRPTDHVVVLGDHGHSADGRHFAGIDAPTYAAYWGPAFSHPLHHAMAITDHASLWAHVFGLRFGNVPWIEDYFRGANPPPTTELPRESTSRVHLPTVIAFSVVALSLLLLALGLAGLQFPRRALYRSEIVGGAVIVGILGAAMGYEFSSYRPLIYARTHVLTALGPGILWAIPATLTFFAVRRTRLAADPRHVAWASVWATLTFLFAVPTVYRFGGFVASTGAFLLVALGAFVFSMAHRRWRAALASVVFVALLGSLWSALVINFRLLRFGFYAQFLRTYEWPVITFFFVLATWLLWRAGGNGVRAAFGWFLGGLLALAVVTAPPAFAILPCVLAPVLVVIALAVPRMAPIAICVALPAYAFFFGGTLDRIEPVLGALLAFLLFARVAPSLPPGLRALGVLVLLWAVHWASFGCRIAGIDFNYFFTWLPPDAPVEATWALNFALTAALYIALPLLGLVLYANGSRTETIDVHSHLGQSVSLAMLKVGFAVTFAVFFVVRAKSVSSLLLSDVLLEVAFWVLMLITLTAAIAGAVRRAPTLANAALREAGSTAS